MDYITHNDLDLSGTGFMGYVEADYSDLVKAFGEPMEGTDDGKTDVMWTVLFSRKRIASIYNWKDGKGYLGEAGKAPEEIRLWHVGGKRFEAARPGRCRRLRDAEPVVRPT